MGYGDSNGHVTDDVTLPRKVKVVTQLSLGPDISKRAGDRGDLSMKIISDFQGRDLEHVSAT